MAYTGPPWYIEGLSLPVKCEVLTHEQLQEMKAKHIVRLQALYSCFVFMFMSLILFGKNMGQSLPCECVMSLKASLYLFG